MIELVVKLPEGAFELLTTKGVDWLGAEHILSAVANGTPLPKGHGRLIDADAFLKAERPRGISEELWTMCGIYNRIGAMPTIVEADKEGEQNGTD